MNQYNQTDKHSSNSDSSLKNANAFGMCSLSRTRHSKGKTQDQGISSCIPTLLHCTVFLTDVKIRQVWEEEEKNTIGINIR
jgi:hypothetical protein